MDASAFSTISQNSAVYASRRQRLKQLIRANGLDCLLISAPANRFYLSGFELHDPQHNESAGRLLVTASGPDWLATDSRYELAARQLWSNDHIFIYGPDSAADIRRLALSNGLLIGVETVCMPQKFWSALSGFTPGPKPCLIPMNGLVESLRIIKDAAEISDLKASFRLNHQFYDWIKGRIDNGVADITESELAWESEKFYREHGAQELAFSSIIASGTASALPHAIPRNMKIARETPVLVDTGCRYNDYCSDQTRTFWHGQNPSREFAQTLELVQKAQKAALEAMRPGMPCKDAYSIARDIFIQAGAEKHFTHGLGHGVGLETHEAPSLSPRSTEILQPGMTVTVEPGLYFSGRGGARWEHTVLVEEDGVCIL